MGKVPGLENHAKEAANRPIAVSRLMTELDRRMDPGAYIVSELVSADSHIRKYVRIDHTPPAPDIDKS